MRNLQSVLILFLIFFKFTSTCLAEGGQNLRSEYVAVCQKFEFLSSKLTPPNLLANMTECINQNNLEDAVDNLILASLYVGYDGLRLQNADFEAIKFLNDLFTQTMNKLPQDIQATIKNKFKARISTDTSETGRTCKEIRRIGRPSYPLDYINGLQISISDSFDSYTSWETSVNNTLPCQSIPDENGIGYSQRYFDQAAEEASKADSIAEEIKKLDIKINQTFQKKSESFSENYDQNSNARINGFFEEHMKLTEQKQKLEQDLHLAKCREKINNMHGASIELRQARDPAKISELKKSWDKIASDLNSANCPSSVRN